MANRALITITYRTVEHNDAEAAGFTDGYWWTVSDPLGYWESATATRDASTAYARRVAEDHGVPADAIDVVEALDLADRATDEARVKQLIAAAAA